MKYELKLQEEREKNELLHEELQEEREKNKIAIKDQRAE